MLISVMLTQYKLKILVIGNPLMIRRLSSRIDAEKISITSCSKNSEAADWLARELFDMVIIDNQVENSDLICKEAAGAANGTVALMLREKAVDWNKMRSLNVDGYLPDEAGAAELMARIKAYSRRKPLSEPEAIPG
jgi:DNA-binding response OmpR family regulator